MPLYAYEQTSCRINLSFLRTGTDSTSPQKRSSLLVPKIMAVMTACNGSIDIKNHNVIVTTPIPVAVRYKAYACSRSIAGIVVSIRMEGMDVCRLYLLCAVKEAASATGCSLFRRVLPVVSVNLNKRRPRPELGFYATENEVVTTTTRLITVFYHVISSCLPSVDSYEAAVWRHIQENINIRSHSHENLESYKTDMMMMMMMMMMIIIIIIVIISNINLLKSSGFITYYMVLALR